MSIAEKLTTIAENEQKVYEAGKASAYDEFWDTFQQNGNRRAYQGAFGSIFDADNFKPKYPIRFDKNDYSAGVSCFAFFGCTSDKALDMSTVDVDFSTVLSMHNVFHNAKVDNVEIDIKNADTVNGLFYIDYFEETALTTATIKNSLVNAEWRDSFTRCYKLVNLTFSNCAIGKPLSLAYSNLLSDESVESVINALYDYGSTSGSDDHKVTFHSDVVDKLTQEQMDRIAAKGWEIG